MPDARHARTRAGYDGYVYAPGRTMKFGCPACGGCGAFFVPPSATDADVVRLGTAAHDAAFPQCPQAAPAWDPVTPGVASGDELPGRTGKTMTVEASAPLACCGGSGGHRPACPELRGVRERARWN